mmetsp:Transcript_7914/g.10338  ORF Transcript_7914/g.10338 Transcript_7914/m.10338 type:complete len:418 (+) Transcript_7914:184-1437(+)
MSKEAREIVNSTESLELDLKGYGFSQAQELIQGAFEDDRELNEMIRVTLIVGAGKEKRQKYDQELGKWIRQGLREIGYEEDNGASCSFACQGTFKYQHDTGKNLMYVHVFPRAIQKQEPGNDVSDEIYDDSTDHGSYNAAEWLCIVSSEDIFSKMMNKKMPAWIQKRRCLHLFKECQEKVAEGERKMACMKALEKDEERLYTEAVDLEGKIKILADGMKLMVENGKLTASEKETVLAQIAEKQDTVKKELECVGSNSKLKLKLEKQTAALVERKDKISKITPYRLPVLREAEIKILYKKLLPLEKLEVKAGAKGLWSNKLSQSEVSALKGKAELDEQLAALLGAARCWFEEDDEFEARISSIRSVISTRIAKKTEAKAKAQPNGGWATVGKKKNKKTDFSKLLKKRPQTGGFNALMD